MDDAERTSRGSASSGLPQPAGPAPAVDGGTLRALVRRVAVVDAGAALADVVAAMAGHDASCAVVRLPDGGLGIVTDHDLRTRVLAAGLPAGTPVGTVASSPAVVARPGTATDDAVRTLLARGIRHLPVVGPDGAVLGVVEDADLLAVRSRTPVLLRRAIGRAATPQALADAARGVPAAVVDAVASGLPAAAVTDDLSVVLEAVVARAVELAGAGRGAPPVPFVLLVTGSVARGDAVLSSDVDTLLVHAGRDDDPGVRRWMRDLAADVLATLAECGLYADANGVRADDPRFSRSADAWREAVAAWARDPAAGQGDVYLSALLDARPTGGAAAWAPVVDALRGAAARPLVRTVLARVATAVRPPTRLLRDLVVEGAGEHAGTLDLKRGALPAVLAARYLATLLPAAPAGTAARLRAAGTYGLLRPQDAADLAEAHGVVQQVRLAHQARAVAAGRAPDDHLAPEELSRLERRGLREAFKVVARVQHALPPPVARP